MTTTLTSSGFESGTPAALLNTSNTTFDAVSTSGITFDATHARTTLAAKVANSAVGTRGMWWSSGSMGGTQTTIYGRLYVYFTAAPPALARLVNIQSGGAVLLGVGITTARTVQIRNVKAGTTIATSTTALATNTWHRIEYSVTMSATAAHCTVRIYAAGNVDSSTITETINDASGMALAATCDSVMHGAAFAAAQTWSVWLDDVKLQVGTGATWLGPTAITPPAGNPGDFVLQYDMNADTWPAGSSSLPSLLVPYAASKSNWGYTAPEHITSGYYGDGSRYVQLKMQKYLSNPGLAHWFGPGDYGCRFHYADAGLTSITTGRVQWTEEFSGAALVKTSMMGWFDRNTILTRDGGKKPIWPDAGERDLLEQWVSNLGGQGTMHKGPLDSKGKHPMQAKPYPGVDESKRVTFRATFLATKAYVEIQQDDGSWKLLETWTDSSYWQPDRGYHVEGALAYSQQISNGAVYNDPKRGNATRKISNLKVWSGTDPGDGGGGSTDVTAPTGNGAPTAVASTTSTGATVTLVTGADAGSGIGHYEIDRAYDSISSPGTPDAATITTIQDALTITTYFDGALNQGDKVYYRQRIADQVGNITTSSSWSTMLTVPTVVTTPPICVLSVAPADSSSPAGDSATVTDGSASVIFSAPNTVGADTITIDPGDGTGTVLSINPADGATDPDTGSVVYTYGPGAKSYKPIATAQNAAGSNKDDVVVNVIAQNIATTQTPAPRDVYQIPGVAAYRAGDLVDNDLYMALGLDQADDYPRLVTVQGVRFCVDQGGAGATPSQGGGGNANDPDILIVSGALSVATGVATYTLGTGGTFTELRAYVETAPAGGPVTVDYKIGSTLIGTVVINSGQTSGVTEVNVVATATQVLTWNVTQVGGTIAGANLHASWSGAT